MTYNTALHTITELAFVAAGAFAILTIYFTLKRK